MITELFLVAVVNYMQVKSEVYRPYSDPSRDAPWTIVSSLMKTVKTEDELLFFVAMAEVESKFDLDAENKQSRAFGPLQVMPFHIPKSERGNVVYATIKGVEIYRWFFARFKKPDVALAHYNGGYKAAKSGECRAYADKVLGIYKKMRVNWKKHKRML